MVWNNRILKLIYSKQKKIRKNYSTDIKIDNNALMKMMEIDPLKYFMLVNQNISIFKIVDKKIIVRLESLSNVIIYILLLENGEEIIIQLKMGLYEHYIILNKKTCFKQYIESENLTDHHFPKVRTTILQINKFLILMAINRNYLSACLNANRNQLSRPFIENNNTSTNQLRAKCRTSSDDLFEELKILSNLCCHNFCIFMRMVRLLFSLFLSFISDR
jgi:hypothetical protein